VHWSGVLSILSGTLVQSYNYKIPLAVQVLKLTPKETALIRPVMCFWLQYTVKNISIPGILGYFVASFPYFNGASSVYVCIRKSMEW